LKKTQQEKPLLWYIINIIGKTKEQKTAAGGARKENTICTDLTNYRKEVVCLAAFCGPGGRLLE
jgi:hypothetical protein